MRISGDRNVRFWEQDTAIGRIRWYRVPSDRPALPFPHIFDDPVQCGEFKGAQKNLLVESLPDGRAGVLEDRVRAHNGTPPPWTFVEGRFCGSPEAWASGGRRGIDPPLVWGWDWRSECCRGDAMAGTPYTLMRWGADGVSAEDSRVSDDPGTDCTDFEAGVCTPWLQLPFGIPPGIPPADRARFYLDPAGSLFILYPDGTFSEVMQTGPDVILTDHAVPVWDAGARRFTESRITDPGSGAVSILSSASVRETLYVAGPAGGTPDAFLRRLVDGLNRTVELARTAPGGTAYGEARLTLRAQTTGVWLDLHAEVGSAAGGLKLDGVEGFSGVTVGFTLQGGVVMDAPDATELQTALGLGSAAYADTTDFDAAGDAAAAEAAAEAYADANFQPLGTLPAADADSATLGAGHSITSANDTYEATGVIVTLPSAGTYIVSGCARGTAQFSVGGSGALLAKLRDTTNAADLPNTVTRFAVGTLTGTRFDGNALLMSDPFAVAGATDVELYVASTGAGTWTTRQVSTELTKVVAWKIGD